MESGKRCHVAGPCSAVLHALIELGYMRQVFLLRSRDRGPGGGASRPSRLGRVCV